MVENEILKHYKHLANKDGFLEVDKDFTIENVGLKKRGLIGAQKCLTPFGEYYKKFNRNTTGPKPRVDAEILLSQVYSKLGFNSTIYVPVEKDGVRMLLCDNLFEENKTMFAKDYHYLISKGKSTFMADNLFSKPADPFFREQYEGNPLLSYFTDDALRQRLDMRIVDVACRNIDRTTGNFMYDIEGLKQNPLFRYYSTKECVSTGLKLFDYEGSGCTFSLETWDIEYANRFRHNEFGAEDMYASSVVREMKRDDDMLMYFSPSNLAERMGSVDIPSIAEDIKNTINYQINPDYVETLDRTFDEIAEELSK